MRDFILILHKELIDIFRDKRSFITLFIPVLLFPMMFMLMGTQLDNDRTEKNIPCIVECVDVSGEARYRSLFDGSDLIRETDVKTSATEDLKNGAVYAVLTFEGDTVTLLYNDASSNSGKAMGNLYAYLEANDAASADAALQQKYGVTIESVRPFRLSLRPLSDVTGGVGNAVMASIAPMLLVVMIMSGGVSVAVDLFTGEKERGTLESLMATQVSRMSILMAKFCATLLLSLMGMVLSILAYVISLTVSDSALALMTGGAQTDGVKLHLEAGQIVSLVLVCVSLSVFAVSLMTLIGLHAKTVKEAQSQMSLLTIFPTLLSGLTMFMESASIRPVSMWVPVFNAIVSIKMIFLGTAQTSHIVFTALSCLLYSAGMWVLSVRMLRSEKLLRG